MKRLLFILASLAFSAAMAVGVAALPAYAADPQASQALCEGSGGTWNAGTASCGNPGETPLPQQFAAITNLLLFVIGAIAVIMIIVGGIRYVTSSGDQTATAGAKNTILFAIIGLIVAFMAYAIVNFVVGQF